MRLCVACQGYIFVHYCIPRMNILLVEDEPKVAAFIKKGLEEQLHKVALGRDGIRGIRLALEQDFELVILDGILPAKDGFEVCKQIRRFKREVPILMLSALGTVN